MIQEIEEAREHAEKVSSTAVRSLKVKAVS